MTTYFVDDAGSATAPYDTWAKAATSINQLDAAVAFASGDIVYFGHDMQDQATNTANLTITGPTSGAPTVFISATTGSSPPAYQKGTGNQIDTTEGAYSITFDGSFALYGIRAVSGAGIVCLNNGAKSFYTENCNFCPAANAGATLGNFTPIHNNPVIDLTADGTTNRSGAVTLFNSQSSKITNISYINAAYRTGTVFTFAANPQIVEIVGGDFSGFTNATTCEIANVTSLYGPLTLINCKTAATWTAVTGTPGVGGVYKFIGCGSANQPVSLYMGDKNGALVSSASIYRTGGQTIESTPTAWLATTNAAATIHTPFYMEWIYGVISSTGSKTFDLYVTNDTADLTNAEIWLEVEYKADASSGKWTLITDKPVTITDTATTQDDDTTSTWNGSGPAFTYKQKLSVTATVNTTGQFRARVCVGKASIASSSNLYIDPQVTVS